MVNNVISHANKTQDIKAPVSFLVGECINVPGQWYILILQEKSPEAPHSGCSQTSPYVSLHLAGPDLYLV